MTIMAVILFIALLAMLGTAYVALHSDDQYTAGTCIVVFVVCWIIAILAALRFFLEFYR